LFLVLVAGLAALLGHQLIDAFMGNPAVNGVILGILIAGIVYIFRQVVLLDPEIEWIESFRNDQADPALARTRRPPRLLAPIARMLAAQQGRRVSLSASSLQALLDGIASRLAETREASRYLIGVLIFLGLLGTFYGLLETVRSVGGVLAALSGGGGDAPPPLPPLKTRVGSPLPRLSPALPPSPSRPVVQRRRQRARWLASRLSGSSRQPAQRRGRMRAFLEARLAGAGGGQPENLTPYSSRGRKKRKRLNAKSHGATHPASTHIP